VLGSPTNGSVDFACDVCLGSFGLRARDWNAVFPHFLVRPLFRLHLLDMARGFAVVMEVSVAEVSVGAFMR
jgi:hypothetical protein